MIEVKEIPVLPPRPKEAHKGDFGKILVVAGSAGMMGAACLTTEAALRAGAGLVTLGVPHSLLPIAMTKLTCAMTRAFPETACQTFSKEAVEPILEFAAKADVVALGPGIGQHPDTVAMVHLLLPRLKTPLVLDADGLNAVATQMTALKGRPAPTILTPHPGEFSRLSGRSTAALKQDRLELAAGFAREYGCVVVLKLVPTLVSDGTRFFVNTTGNPGMATGGSGDVLTGVIAALLGQGLDPFVAAQLGVYVHGLSGDFAREEKGEVGMIASDLVGCLPRAFVALT